MTRLFRLLSILCVLCLPPAAIIASTPAGAADLRILADTFPVSILARSIAAGVPGARVDLLIPAGTGCPHDYAPTPADLRRLSQADVLVLNGLGLASALAPAAQRSGLRVISAGDAAVDAPSEHAGHADHADGHGHGHAHEVNPHVFAAPGHAARMVRAMGAGLAAADAEHADAWRASAEAVAVRLEALSLRLREAGAKFPAGVVLYHDGLEYLAEEAGIPVAAVVQDDEDQAPSAARMLDILRLLRERRPALLVGERQFPPDVMETLSRESGVPLIFLDSAASGPEDASPAFYEEVMAENIRLLEAAGAK